LLGPLLTQPRHRRCTEALLQILVSAPSKVLAWRDTMLFLYYNLVSVHQTLKVTPAMAAGVTKCLWEMKDFVNI
jgi:hypothetical protein